MEYLLVRFGCEERAVVIDEKGQGRTNQVLEVEKGTHKISIEAPPFDFTPSLIKIVLKNTTPLSPREVKPSVPPQEGNLPAPPPKGKP